MKTNDTKYDKKIRNLKNKPVIVTILIIFGILAGLSVLIDLTLKITNIFESKNPNVKIESPIIDAKLKIDDINDTCFYYSFEITNNGNSIAKNIVYYSSDPDMFSLEINSLMKRDLTPKSTFNFIPNIAPIKMSKVGVYIFLLDIEYEDSLKNQKNCYYRFVILNYQLKLKEYFCEDKNCEDGKLSNAREQMIENNVFN